MEPAELPLQGEDPAGFSGFKAHAAFGYWNNSMLSQERRIAARWASSAG